MKRDRVTRPGKRALQAAATAQRPILTEARVEGPVARAGTMVRLGRCRCGTPIFAQVGHGESFDLQPGEPIPAERDDLTCFTCRTEAAR